MAQEVLVIWVRAVQVILVLLVLWYALSYIPDKLYHRRMSSLQQVADLALEALVLWAGVPDMLQRESCNFVYF